MSDFPVNNTQIAIYLTFTFLSIAISIVSYCVYQHGFNLSEGDCNSYNCFYKNVKNC